MRAIIICAGEATRWANHTGTPKHLIEIEGEKILHRTVRLLRENGVDDVWVVSKDDPEYKVEGAKQYVAPLNYEENAEADKFLSSKEIWNVEGRTLIIYGDCYFSDESIRQMVVASKRREDWMLFCRPEPSKITGSKWGECFSFSLPSSKLCYFEDSLHRIAKLYKSGDIKRCGGWETYMVMSHGNVNRHLMTTNWFKIDDWTDDFDYPSDYDEWLRRKEQHG